MNYLWSSMIGVGIVYGALTGNISEVTNAALESSKEAVTLCITMLGVMSFWMGMMRIAENSGMIANMTNKISPFLDFLFPSVKNELIARKYIATNIIANVFGLGWAATPAGIMAMEELAKIEKVHNGGDCKVASDAMCTFLVLNISSLQIIPMNIIAYRSQYGSVNPTAVIGPGLVATICSTLAAIVFCKIMCRKGR